MSQEQIIAAITAALQATDENGQYANLILMIQQQYILALPTLTLDQLQVLCTILSINTNGS